MNYSFTLAPDFIIFSVLLSLSLPHPSPSFSPSPLSHSLFRRKNGQEGFIPANYVKEIEPSKVKKVVKKKEMINVPVKVKKTRIEKRYTKIIGNISIIVNLALLYAIKLLLARLPVRGSI